MGAQSTWEKSRTQQVRPGVSVSGGEVIQRDTLNLIPGAGVTINQADNPATKQVDVTIGATGTGPSGAYLQSGNNLSDVASPATALANIGGQPLDSDLTTISAFGTFNVGFVKRISATNWQTQSGINVSDILWSGSTAQYIDGTGAYQTFPTSSAAWGSITGTLSSQSDLQSALNAKLNTSSVGSAAYYSIGTSGGAVPLLSNSNTWTGAQNLSAGASVGTTRQILPTTIATITPASTANWYRLGTLAAANTGQRVDLTVLVYRSFGSGHQLLRLRLGKSTPGSSQGTRYQYEQLGNYSAANGIGAIRIVDGGTNGATSVDVQFLTTDSYVLSVAADSLSTYGAPFFAPDAAFTNQGTAAAGVSIPATTYLRYEGDTVLGLIESISTGRALAVQSLSLPGTSSQYVTGTGALATMPSGGSGTVTSVSAGAGMNFTTITGSGAVSLGTPGSCSNLTSNNASGTTHTHNISGFMPTTGGTFSGAITAPGVTDSSDARFKTDIRDLRDGLEVVRALMPRRFFNLLSGEPDVGFVAQEIRNVLPEVVVTDDNGNLAVAYQRIVAPIVAALHEIDARLKRLEAR